MFRREHRAEGRQRNVERTVVERQCFGIRQLKLHVQALGLCARGALLEQVRHIVGRGHARETPGGSQGGVAVARGNIQHQFPGAHVHRFGQRLADDLQGGADDCEIAAGPGGLLALLDRVEVDVGCGRRLYRRLCSGDIQFKTHVGSPE